jgi:hypothetical protein
MTNAAAINAIASDASVRHAHRRTKMDGTIVEPSSADLKAIATSALQLAMGELAIDPNIADRLYEQRYSLTVASGTNSYDVGQYGVEKIRDILLGSNSRPLRPFFEDSGDFYEWKERRYAGSDLSGATVPYAAYVSGRPNGNLELTFWPGPGSETSITLVHNHEVASPFKLSIFPPKLHSAVLIGAIRWANGGRQGYSDQWEQAKANIAKGLDPARGTTTKLRKGEALRRFVRRQNASVSGSSSSYPSSVKTR